VPLRWTPDGRALAYVDTTYRAIWAVPVDGGAAYAVATYAPETSPIAWFAWSGDGQHLGFMRVTTEFDIVLFSALRP
jgi:sugar lactone lactonase YvrE